MRDGGDGDVDACRMKHRLGADDTDGRPWPVSIQRERDPVQATDPEAVCRRNVLPMALATEKSAAALPSTPYRRQPAAAPPPQPTAQPPGHPRGDDGESRMDDDLSSALHGSGAPP